ncbi:charged multivesicular body protein 6 isoform X2 [Ursus arctos]|uniref:charged multivesicular body protein 6 isoform X2 n=1 Tax=Ursus arctos TaxID=9644 RepID=UPI0025474DA7|nr:charged multivesicular body protein 6 isoform X2 [Ursus arctos]
MGNLFGRKKQSRVTEQDKAVLQLKQQRDKLKQYQKRVTQQLEREREIARQLLRDGKKERAKLLLRKKRYREQLLDKTENQITSLETMVQSIEFTQIEMKVVEGLQVGNECLKKMHQVMSIEEVERILEETQEAVEYQRQIDELLAGSFTQEDEDAILEELNAITEEQMELPEVPAEPLPKKKPAYRTQDSGHYRQVRTEFKPPVAELLSCPRSVGARRTGRRPCHPVHVHVHKNTRSSKWPLEASRTCLNQPGCRRPEQQLPFSRGT